MSNKNRVFVAIYTRIDTSSLSTLSAKSKTNPDNYHWGIWIEPKGSTGQGTSFDLEDSITFSSVTNPFGWRFRIDEHKSLPPRMLGRVMIGKLSEEMTNADIMEVLKMVPLPSDPHSPVQGVVDWVKAAIAELQEVGAAERFSIDTLIGDALVYTAQWLAKPGKEAGKVNYTWSRTFP